MVGANEEYSDAVGVDGTPNDYDFFRRLRASGVPSGRYGMFLYGDTQVQVTLGNGFRCVGVPLRRLSPLLSADAVGRAERAIDFTSDPVLSDIALAVPGQWNFQFWYRDAGSVNLADAVAIDFVP